MRGVVRPSFPSKTFPNHYTLVTGLRPDRNGMVENNMLDPLAPGVNFAMSNKTAVVDAFWWNDGTPIWVSAEKAGVPTATMFWPGSEAAIHGVRPGRWLPFDQSKPAAARVEQVLAWLDEPAPPRFVTLYFDEVDSYGHWNGPDSTELNAAVAKVDAAIARLTEGLAARGVAANLVITADHGMAQVSGDRVILMDDLLPVEAGRILGQGAFLTYYPAPGWEARVEAILLARHEHMTCWRKADIPARFHYGQHRRVAPLFCLPQTGWEVLTKAAVAKTPVKGGAHGFDPYAPEMAAVFIANGPAFRRGASAPTTDNVDVYPLLAKLLAVKPEPNDGGQALARLAK
ncbi:ectonucleotide pyrophosphatase/phosphodiesterase [Phenylobacterium sp.]|uniref:alkaline phosphatase family protein n=1 Tax=Phenylobacterium sp. TaxID=1871053 RepID=UPI00289720D4|nr:ectonucleotide pyrophosphatase/phosphodiesterase [Phenylobacterium sp.]